MAGGRRGSCYHGFPVVVFLWVREREGEGKKSNVRHVVANLLTERRGEEGEAGGGKGRVILI